MPCWSIHAPIWNETSSRRVAHMIPESVDGALDQETTPAARIAQAVALIVAAIEEQSGGKCRVFTQGNLSPESPAFVTLTIIPFAPVVGPAVGLQPEATAVANEHAEADAPKPCVGCP